MHAYCQSFIKINKFIQPKGTESHQQLCEKKNYNLIYVRCSYYGTIKASSL